MKSNIITTGKRALTGVFMLLGSLFISCVTEPAEAPGAGNTENGKALLMLSVNTPQPTLPTALSRSQTSGETAISEIKVLVFEESGDDYLFSYYVNGTGISSSGQQTQFKALLSGANVPVKLLILANTGEEFMANVPEAGTPEDEVSHMMNKSFGNPGLEEILPMYGELPLPEGILSSETYVLPVTVLRGVARVDVVKDLNPGAPEFILEEVYAYRANDKIQLIPDELADASLPKVTRPSVPGGSLILDDPIFKSVPGGAESIIQLYLPESKEATTNTEKIKKATTIVIGGRFGGGENPVTYYRADFNSGMDGHPFGQILRNHRYIFKIKSVSREGWGTPEEAAENLSSSIVVDIQPWEDFSSEMYLGDDRFGISAREISLRYVRNRERSLQVESTFAYRIEWLQDGAPSGNGTSDYNVTVSNDNFDAWISADDSNGENITTLHFRTRKDNNLGDVITDTLRATAGPWKVDIIVKQDNSALYKNRYMAILTVVGVGNLGVNMLEPDASGLAMRRILDKQFSPSGVINLGGASFTRILNNGNWVGTSASDNLFILKRLFGSQNVIYFPHAVSVSSDVAALLAEWLEENPHRVLIIGTDSDSSNKQLRLNPKFAADGTWSFDASAVTTTFARASEQAANEEFFNGPFGPVSPTVQYNRADGTAGYVKDPSAELIPLITANKEGYTNCIFFGVNKKNRVVYHGDAQLFQTSQMSNNTGAVNSDLDKLMANTWAWIAEQVIYGDNYK